MKQLIQNFKSGVTSLIDTPLPRVSSGNILIKAHRSLVSLGTEKMLVSFGQASLIGKIKQQPHRVKDVVGKMKSDGIKSTLDAVNLKLDTPINLGYSNAGEIVEIGKDVKGFKVGDRVVSNGSHAEYVSVPKNLVAKIPDGVSYDEACFTVVSSIGLQGIRLINPTFGETIVVVGLGLIGLITIQLLKSNGCNVIGIDIDNEKVNIANELGIDAFSPSNIDPVKYIMDLTSNVGADGVIITASTKSNDVIKQAAQMSRKLGRIVLVGVIGLEIDRADFYEKELSFQVSCSYGPGRYTNDYEKKGNDYPIGYVRWTENRNFQAILHAIKNKTLNVEKLITNKISFEDFDKIYGNIKSSKSIATILSYGVEESNYLKTTHVTKNIKNLQSLNQLAIIGAGNFTQARVIPALKKTGVKIKYIMSSNGLSSTILSKRVKATYSTTDIDVILNDSDVSNVLITTRHNLHAPMVKKVLLSGKSVFVEKPLAINKSELEDLVEVANKSNGNITVGFNRRFSPHSIKLKSILGENPAPMTIVTTMNAGFIPLDSWVQDLSVGGGRIVGEACHLIDLISFLCDSLVESVSMNAQGLSPSNNTDNGSIHLKYKNGSLGIINYLSQGHKSYPKERVEVFYQGKNFIIDNFRTTYAYGYGSPFKLSNKILKTKQDKGHNNQFNLLIKNWSSKNNPLIPFECLVNTTKASFAALESLALRKEVKI